MSILFRTRRLVLTTAAGLFFVVVAAGVSRAGTEVLPGNTGSSARWGSGWLDLATPTTFKRGERLLLTIGGTAEKIVVRLLPQKGDPDTSDGVLKTLEVPASRVVDITLSEGHKNVIQISVHGGPNPWGQYPLGGGNGPAVLTKAKHVVP